jgi:hypothetical protein
VEDGNSPERRNFFLLLLPSFCWHSRHETQRKRIFHRRLFVNDPFQLGGTSALGSSSSSSGAPSFDIQHRVRDGCDILQDKEVVVVVALGLCGLDWSFIRLRSWWWFRHSNREVKKEKGAIDQKGEFA